MDSRKHEMQFKVKNKVPAERIFAQQVHVKIAPENKPAVDDHQFLEACKKNGGQYFIN